ncbi:MAG: cell wall hydrolase [Lachnospiraceae bacterium]|jgi:spore germination cell wall hydrolase CwlJ-like protein|nr:cell wall hydrolase [Lachnospiraceae bacterium]
MRGAGRQCIARRTVRGIARRGIAGCAAVALLLCAVPTTAYADVKDTEKKLNEAKEEKKKTENALNSTREELGDLQETTEGLKGELNSLNNSLTQVSNNLADLEEQIRIKLGEIDKTQAALEEAERIEREQYEAMKKRIQFMYEKRDYILLEMLFGSASFSELLNRNEYIEQLSAYDRQQLASYQETRAQIEQTKARLIGEKEELDELRVKVEAEQSRFAGLVSQTSGKISNYQHKISEAEQEMLAYEQELAEQNNNIAQLQKQLEEERRLSLLAAQSAWRDISEISFADGDRYLLANLIYCEAGNQPFEGQVAVGAVVMNRVMSAVFPDTVVGVIYQNKQFSPVASGRLALALAEDHATPACYQAADQAMKGATTVGSCLFFRTPIEGLSGKQIGGHIFY